MNTNQSWTCLYFLLFFIVQERSDACDWMINQYNMKNRFCLSLLKEMGGEMNKMSGPFPHLAYSEVDKAKAEDQMKFLAEATEQIVSLFNTLLSHVDEIHWDNGAVENFLNIISTRQLVELKKCTAAYAGGAGTSSSERKLKKHFMKLEKILKKANYSRDASEQIRTVVKHHLKSMNIIAASVRQKLMN